MSPALFGNPDGLCLDLFTAFFITGNDMAVLLETVRVIPWPGNGNGVWMVKAVAKCGIAGGDTKDGCLDRGTAKQQDNPVQGPGKFDMTGTPAHAFRYGQA